MDSEGGDLNSPTFHGMDSEGADSNSLTFREAGADAGPLNALVGSPVLGIYAGLLGHPIAGPVRCLLFVKKLTISDCWKLCQFQWSMLAISSERFMRGAT